ncbi:hypothetical protein RSAG8_02932, partial [Rhizoctonia solani AG-8 WAC10335]
LDELRRLEVVSVVLATVAQRRVGQSRSFGRYPRAKYQTQIEFPW